MDTFGEVSAPPSAPAERHERPPAGEDVWLTLGEASRVLGINSTTLRRWADRGQVESYTTPGGHRRFRAAAVRALLPGPRERRPALAELGETGNRMATAYRRALAAPAPAPAWMADLTEEERVLLRERGRAMADCLLAHLDATAPGPAMANLHEAERHAEAHGRDAARRGAPLAEAVAAFQRFCAPFLEELAGTAGRRGLDTSDATSLLLEAETALDKLLLAFVTGWQE